MHLISFDASPKQISRLRNGHRVRIKRGSGFNLVVNPSNYNTIDRAFKNNRALELQLSNDELEANRQISPELQEGITGRGIFNTMHGGSLQKMFNSKKGKAFRRALKPVGRAFKNYAQDVGHQKLAEAHMYGADYIPDNENAQLGYNLLAQAGHDAIGYNKPVTGFGLGAGFGYGVGNNMNVHDALRLANLATANANHHLAKLHNATVHGQIAQPTIQRYWDQPLDPISRGTGIRGNVNFIRGRGSMLSRDDMLPQALQSQPYGANFHMQFQLPPEYRRYNDGTDIEGRGLYI